VVRNFFEKVAKTLKYTHKAEGAMTKKLTL